MDEHVRLYLISLGLISGDGYNRWAIHARCPKCRATVLQGLDNAVCGLPVRAGLVCLDAVGELLALAGGRRTYELRPKAGGRIDLQRRDRWMMARRGYPVVADHRCGQQLPVGQECATLASLYRNVVQPPSEAPF